MVFLQTLFSSATALIQGAKHTLQTTTRALEDVVIEIGVRFRSSKFGQEVEKAFSQGRKNLQQGIDLAVQAVSSAYQASREILDEEREYKEKTFRDGRLKEADQERLQELQKERERLKREIGDLKAGIAAIKLQTEPFRSAVLSSDELSANTGIIASKRCPDCGGTMRIRQGGRETRTGEHRFWWECISNIHGYRCRTLKVELRSENLEVARSEDPDLDGEQSKRHFVWTRPLVVQQTHARVRSLLGELDDDLMCPVHALPMRLIEKSKPGGHLLDSYQYVCSSIQVCQRVCGYTVLLETFPQVASLLRRKTSKGIIGNE